MSVLMVRVVPQGIVFGADRNITEEIFTQQSRGGLTKHVMGQSQRKKIHRWPNKDVLIGYVGAASIGGQYTDEWLYRFIGRNLEFSNFSELSQKLLREIEEQRGIDEGQNKPEGIVVHIAGFEERNSELLPTVWFIRNVYGLNKNGYFDIRKEFQCGECFWEIVDSITKEYTTKIQMKSFLEQNAEINNPLGFQQGIDIDVFNIYDWAIRSATVQIEEKVHPDFPIPQTLEQWEQQMKMSILTYGNYYEVYNRPGERYVGGGVDVLSVEWPD